jgi:outer membrane protein insertion porin family
MSSSADGFDPRPGKQATKAFLFALGILVLTCFRAPMLGAAVPGPLITKVEIWVDGQPGPESLRNLISLVPGDAFSLKAVSDNIKQIYLTGLFSNIEVFRSGEEEVGLKFVLTRRLLIRKIRIEGQTGVSSRKLRDALISLRLDNFFSEEKLARAREELARALKNEGYFKPKISTEIASNPRAPEVDVTFAVEAGKRFLIDTIDIVGEGVVTARDLMRKMKSREGDAYVPSKLEQDIARLKDLYSTLGYQRADVELTSEKFDPEYGTVALTLFIDPHERIDIVINGADVPVRIVAPIWEERIFEEWGVSEGEARILSYLRDKGYIFASVTSHLEREDSVIRVTHQVSPGRKFKIRDVRFEGLSYFTKSELYERLDLSSGMLFGGGINGERIYELPGEISVLYQSQGFSEVEVELNFIRDNDKVVAVFQITEGRQQRIRSISIVGASLFSPDVLRTQLGITEDGPYFPPDIQRDIERLTSFYLDQGIRGTQIEASVEAEAEGNFRVRFDIREGSRVTVQSLVITGNLVTRRSTIIRELRIREGDLASSEKIAASKRNLEKLGIFSEVIIEEIPVSEDAMNLVVNLREGERNYVGLGVGLETKNDPWRTTLLEADLRLRGTAEYMRSNVIGRASHLSFVSQFNLAEKRAVVSWEQPYFLFNLPIQTYLNAWIEEEERESFDFEREGVSLTGIRPIFWGLTFLPSLRYARTTLTRLDVTLFEIDRQFYPYSATSLATSFIREKRDDAFNPERGCFSSLALEWAFPLFGTESDYLKGVFKHQQFFFLAPRVNFSSTFRLGLGMGRIPIHERFFAGGSNSFRGEKFDELGPKDPDSGKPVGGKALILFNFETTFPIISMIRNLSGALFYDVGNVFYNRSDARIKDLEHAVGLGLRYRTPLGPIRLEMGWNLSNPERKGKPLVFITIGHVF